MFPFLSSGYFPDVLFADSELVGNLYVWDGFMKFSNFFNIVSGQFCHAIDFAFCVSFSDGTLKYMYSVLNIFFASNIFQITETVICSISVFMVYFFFIRGLPVKYQHDQTVGKEFVFVRVFAQVISKVSIFFYYWFNYFTRKRTWSAFSSFQSSVVRNCVVAFKSGNRFPDFFGFGHDASPFKMRCVKDAAGL